MKTSIRNALILLLLCLLPIELLAAPRQLSTLPQPALQALKKWQPKFEVFKSSDFSPQVQKMFQLETQSPAVQSDDYNGDGTPDYALLGAIGSEQQVAAVVLSSKRSWSVVRVKEWNFKNVKDSEVPGDNGPERGVPIYLTDAAGEAADEFKKTQKRSALQIEAYMGAVELFDIQGPKAKPINLK